MKFLIIGTFLVLFALKLAGYISVSWWIVTSPLWGYISLVILFLLINFIYTLCTEGEAVIRIKLNRIKK